MTQSAIASNDLALLRGQNHSIPDARLNVCRPQIVATLTVSNTPTSNPASSLIVSGDMSDVVVGNRIKITDSSGNTVSWGIVRLAPSGSTLYINPISIGDSGFVQPIQRAISASDTVTVYADLPMFMDYSRIGKGNSAKALLKLWDQVYTTQNEDIPPISNTGAGQSARVIIGGTASFTLPRLGINTSFAFGSETISTYLWTLPTGVTLKAGYATSDAVIEVDAVAGQHRISLTVTDTNAVEHTSYLWLFVSDSSTYLNLFESHVATIDSMDGSRDGWSLSFTLTGENIQDTVMPGALVHFQFDALFNGSSLSTGVLTDIFTGYVLNYQFSHDGAVGTANITAVSPYVYLQSVGRPSDYVIEKSNPSNWSEITSALSNPRGALCHNRWYCRNLFAMHDIDAALITPRKHDFNYNGSSVASGLDIAAQMILGNVGSACDGTIVLRKNPSVENNTFRNALAVGFTIGTSDITAPLAYPRTVIPAYADVRFGAFSYNGSKDTPYYGVKRWGQGASETTLPDFAIHNTQGLTEVLEYVGMSANAQNNTEEPSLSFLGFYAVVDPVYMIWYKMTISSDYDAQGQGWDNVRILPTRVSLNWDVESLTFAVNMSFKRETFGQIADEVKIGKASTVATGSYVAGLGVKYLPQSDLFGVLSGVAIVLNDDGQLAITQNITDASPSFTDITTYLDGTVCDVCFDYSSGFFTSGFILTEALSVYIVTADGTDLNIYRITDIKDPNVVIELKLKTYSMNDSSTTTSVRIACSKTTPGFVVVAWHDQTGVLVGRSTDSGATWGTAVQVGSSVSDTENDNLDIGLAISGTNQLVTAPDSGVNYGIYLATTTGGSFSALSNTETSPSPLPMVLVDVNTATTFYTATKLSLPLYNVDFDAGTAYDSLFNDAPFDATPPTVQLSGNPLNCARSTYTSVMTSSGVSCDALVVRIEFGSVGIVRVEADMYLDYTSRIGFTFQRPYLRATGFVDFSDTFGASQPGTKAAWLTTTWTLSTTTDYVEVLWLSSNNPSGDGTFNNLDLRIDNIKIYDTYNNPVLYKVTAYTTTDVWTDITESDFIPTAPYAMAVDLADNNNLELIGFDNANYDYLYSTDAGSTFTDNDVTDYRCVKRVGDTIILGGIETLDVSFDNLNSVVDKTGDLGVIWGTIGTIKNVLTVGLDNG